MSWDLYGWKAMPAAADGEQLHLSVIGGGHSDVNLGLDWWSADDEATFEEQVDRVISRLRRTGFSNNQALEQFANDAKAFRESSDAKGCRIVSEWF